MRKLILVAAVLIAGSTLAGCMTDKEAAYTDPHCHNQGVATGSVVGLGASALGVATVGGILPGIMAGNIVSDKVEDSCMNQKRVAQKSGYRPQKGAWQNPDTKHLAKN